MYKSESGINASAIENPQKNKEGISMNTPDRSDTYEMPTEKENWINLSDVERIDKFLEDNQWVKGYVINWRDKGVDFSESINGSLWDNFRKKYGIGETGEFCERTVELMSERTLAGVIEMLDDNNEADFSNFAKKLYVKGVRFFDNYGYSFGGEAFYSPDDNRIYLREGFQKTGKSLVKIKHEILHAMVYNLEEAVKKEIDGAVEKERLSILDELNELLGRNPQAISEYVAKNYSKFGIEYALSNSDETLAHMTDPEFVRFINDLERGVVLMKKRGWRDKLNIFKSKRKTYVSSLPGILENVLNNYRD